MASSHAAFSVGAAVSYGWRSVTRNLTFFLPVILIVLGLTFVFQFFHYLLTQNDAQFFSFFVSLASVFVQLFISLGIIKIAISFARGKKLPLSALFGESRLVIRFFVATLLVGLPVWVVMGVAIGLIVLLVIGALGDTHYMVPVLVGLVALGFAVYWNVKMQFFSYFMVDKNVGIVASLKKSYHATNGHFWKLFWLGLLLGLINLLGLLALVVGLLVTIPIDWVSRAYVYNKLVSKK